MVVVNSQVCLTLSDVTFDGRVLLAAIAKIEKFVWGGDLLTSLFIVWETPFAVGERSCLMLD